jgi:hypothetical protein
MASVVDGISDDLRDWIESQPLFFVASAPSGSDGHVNVSPKGLDTFAVVDARTVRYLDLTGSGAETVAHVRQNGRITIMFCAFSGPPRILRLFGQATPHLVGSPGFDERVAGFGSVPHGARAVMEVAVSRVQTSCGFGVPEMGLVGPRDRLLKWAGARSSDELEEYRARKNATSIDGLSSFSPHSSASG